MVRHEAVEALGAIDTEGAIQVLKKYLDSPYRIVRERFISWFSKDGNLIHHFKL